MQEQAANALTPANLEERILEALETPVNYDLVIDRDGVEYVPGTLYPRVLLSQ